MNPELDDTRSISCPDCGEDVTVSRTHAGRCEHCGWVEEDPT